jgi:nicotinate phosphoribosyltransferase
MVNDVLTLEGDPQAGEPLIRPVVRSGLRIEPLPTLEEARQRAACELARLPAHLRALKTKPAYPVQIAPALRNLTTALNRDDQ